MRFWCKQLKVYQVTYRFCGANYTTLLAATSETDALRRFAKRQKTPIDVLAVQEVSDATVRQSVL